MHCPWRRAAGLLLFTTVTSAAIASDDSQASIPPIEISLSEWGLDDLTSIRLGRLGVLREDPDRLVVYVLRTDGPRSRPLESTSHAPPVGGGCLLAAELTGGNVNRLGGVFNTFQRAPSSASFAIDRRTAGRRTLELSYQRADSGFSGFWMHLYPHSPQAGPRTLLDVGELATLSFWIRGREGGERLRLKLADERLDRLGDSIAAGELTAFLPSGRVTTDWQQAIVPLATVPPAIDRTRLATFVLEAVEGAGTVELLRVAFCAEGATLPQLPAPTSAPAAPRPLARAVWVWNTQEIFDRPEERSKLASFLEEGAFTDVYLQLPNRTGQPARLAPDAADPASPLRSLVATMNGLGIAVRALDGHATFVLGDKPRQVLQTIRDVAAFNRAVPAGERFAGVHYDVEPYLLPGFGGPRRQDILTQYLQLVAGMTVEARRAGLEIGVDLPFWYDALDEFDGEQLTASLAGRRRLITEHVLDFVDYVTLMDYRTSAYGPDGVLFHATGELAYATRIGKRLFIGLETGALPDEDYLTFHGEPRSGWPPAGTADEVVVMEAAGDVVTVRLLRGNELERPAMTGSDRQVTVVHWPVSSRLAIPADKLTFSELGPTALDAVKRQVLHELGSTSGFSGFALHHYTSLRDLPYQP